MKKQTKKEINKAIKELKKFLKVCQRAQIECEFDSAKQSADLFVLECKIKNRIKSLEKLKKMLDK